MDLLDSDHQCVIYSVYNTGVKSTTHRVQYVRCMGKCNIGAFVEDLLDFLWNATMDVFDSIDDMWEIQKMSFILIVDRHIPKRKVRVKANIKPWFNDYII